MKNIIQINHNPFFIELYFCQKTQNARLIIKLINLYLTVYSYVASQRSERNVLYKKVHLLTQLQINK